MPPPAITNAAMVKLNYAKKKELGRGSDGAVYLYCNRMRTGDFIAVKVPYEMQHLEHQRRHLKEEIRTMRKFKSDQIVSLLGYDQSWQPYGPALFYEYCEFGDVWEYGNKVRDTYGYVPEVTLWKFFSDMAKGLHYLHDKQPRPIVHRDLKDANIMVARRPGDSHRLPILPDFKIGDFGRAKEFTGEPLDFFGTFEFAPPFEELDEITPASDIWSLAATIQACAFGISPVQTLGAFMRDYQKEHGVDLADDGKYGLDFNRMDDYWRCRIPVIYRPLNVSAATLRNFWDFPLNEGKPYKYSDKLDQWYAGCFVKDPSKRLTAKKLYQFLVPVAERQIVALTMGPDVEDEVKKAEQQLQRGPGYNVRVAVPQGQRAPSLRRPLPPPLPPRPARQQVRVAAPQDQPAPPPDWPLPQVPLPQGRRGPRELIPKPAYKPAPKPDNDGYKAYRPDINAYVVEVKPAKREIKEIKPAWR